MAFNFVSSNIQQNEIVKAADFQYGFDSTIENVSRLAQMVLESTCDFVINGKVIAYDGMNIQVSPIFGVCHSTGIPFGCTTNSPVNPEGDISYISIAESGNLDRIDTLLVKAEEETFDNQQRAFRNFDTNTDTIQYVDTKKRLAVIYKVIKGISGSDEAPPTEQGWVKLAEIVVRANTTEILDDDIHNIETDVAGTENKNWTIDKDATYNIRYISDVNKRFRIDHEENGKHKENIIGTKELNIGNGAGQINGNILPTGGELTIGNEKTSASNMLFSSLLKISKLITDIFEKYVKLGYFAFNGEISVSDILADEKTSLANALIIGTSTTEDTTPERYAYLKFGEREILRIMSNGVIRGTRYSQATEDYDLINKAVTDGIIESIRSLDKRVRYIEANLDPTEAANRVLSKFTYPTITIRAATTQSIELYGRQIIDNVDLSAGDMVLVKNQSDKKKNGIYEVNSTAEWRRNGDYTTSDTLGKTIFEIQEGKVNGGKMYFTLKDSFIVESVGIEGDNIEFLEYLGSKQPLSNKFAVRDTTGHLKSKPATAQNDCVIKEDLLNLIYPIGSLYWSSKPTNPSELFGGTWVQIKDKFILAAGDTYEADSSGGSATVQLTESNLPAHKHGFKPSGSVSSSFNGNPQTGDINKVFMKADSNPAVTGVFHSLGGDIDGEYSGKNVNIGIYNFSFYAVPSGTVTSSFTGTQGNTDNTGSGTSVNVMNPYVVMYCWKRTA